MLLIIPVFYVCLITFVRLQGCVLSVLSLCLIVKHARWVLLARVARWGSF